MHFLTLFTVLKLAHTLTQQYTPISWQSVFQTTSPDTNGIQEAVYFNPCSTFTYTHTSFSMCHVRSGREGLWRITIFRRKLDARVKKVFLREQMAEMHLMHPEASL